MNLTDEFTALIAGFQRNQIDFAVCGGMAMALHGFPRFTNDIDLLILPLDLAGALTIATDCGFENAPEPIKLGQSSGRPVEIWRINEFQGEDHLALDLVLVNGLLDDVWVGRQRFDWREFSLAVVSAAGLAKMKLLAGRPQDLVDIQTLGFHADDPAIQA
jgi:hypothetical protein